MTYLEFCLERLAPDNELFHIVHGIIGEVLEVAELEGNNFDPEREEYLKEFGDILFYLTLFKHFVGYHSATPKPCTIEQFSNHTKRVLYYQSDDWDFDLLQGFETIILTSMMEKGFTIQEIKEANREKLSKRYAKNFTTKEAIERKDTRDSYIQTRLFKDKSY